MPATSADRTRLYRDSLGLCAMHGCFTELQPGGKDAQHIAKAAHIVGENEGSARFDPSVSLADRNKLDNLILMCPTHHEMIDADEEPGPDDMAMIAAVKSGDKTDPAHPAYNGPYAIE